MCEKIPTHIEPFDRLLEGGLLPQEKLALVGQSGSGKTTLALNIGVNLAERGHRVCYVHDNTSSNVLKAIRAYRRDIPYPEVMEGEAPETFSECSMVQSNLPDLAVGKDICIFDTDVLRYNAKTVQDMSTINIPYIWVIAALHRVQYNPELTGPVGEKGWHETFSNVVAIKKRADQVKLVLLPSQEVKAAETVFLTPDFKCKRAHRSAIKHFFVAS